MILMPNLTKMSHCLALTLAKQCFYYQMQSELCASLCSSLVYPDLDVGSLLSPILTYGLVWTCNKKPTLFWKRKKNQKPSNNTRELSWGENKKKLFWKVNKHFLYYSWKSKTENETGFFYILLSPLFSHKNGFPLFLLGGKLAYVYDNWRIRFKWHPRFPHSLEHIAWIE